MVAQQTRPIADAVGDGRFMFSARIESFVEMVAVIGHVWHSNRTRLSPPRGDARDFQVQANGDQLSKIKQVVVA
jgi:hypothetical protein